MFNLARTPFSRADWQDAIKPWVRSLGCWRDGAPSYGGMIVDYDWDHDNETLTLDTVTPDAILRDRYPFGVGTYLTDPDFIVTSASLRSAAERAIRYVTGGFGGPEWGIPFRFQNLAEAGSFSKTWTKDEWATAADIVTMIRKMLGGPDLAFVPYSDSGKLKYDVLTGAPRINGSTIDLPLSVRNSRAEGLHSRGLGRDMVSGVFARANGAGDDRKVGRAGYFTGLPADAPEMLVRDVATNVVATKEESIATSQALAYLADHTWATKQREFRLKVERRNRVPDIKLSDLKLGTRFNARFSGDKFEPPFSEQLYVVALSHNSAVPDVYEPEVQRL
ncbi:hypothetical protein LJR186_001236 [Microbacterium foliorum]